MALEYESRIQSKPFLTKSNNDEKKLEYSSAFPNSSSYCGYLDTHKGTSVLWKRQYFMEILYLDSCQLTAKTDTLFQLFSDNQTIYFRTQSLEQSTKWMTAIQKASTLKIKDVYRFLHVLGESGMTKVVAGKHKLTNQESAIKIVDKRICNNKSLKTEIQILRKLDNDYIVKLHDIIETKKYVYIIMEKCEGGELFDKIIELDAINEYDCCLIMHQIARGVKYMHSVGIIHRDLKPENILCVEPDTIRKVKIADFGISQLFHETDHEDQYLRTMCSVCYTSPEILANKKYDYTADYWSIGIILYILLCGYPPFYDQENHNDEKVIHSIINDELLFDEEDWQHISAETKDLLKGLLCKDPQQRKTCDDILKLVWKVTNSTASFEKARENFITFNFKNNFSQQRLRRSNSEALSYDIMDDVAFEINKMKINVGMKKRDSLSMGNTPCAYNWDSAETFVSQEYEQEFECEYFQDSGGQIKKWKCNKCDFINFEMDRNCLFCSRRWKCNLCALFNRNDNKYCILCKSLRFI